MKIRQIWNPSGLLLPPIFGGSSAIIIIIIRNPSIMGWRTAQHPTRDHSVPTRGCGAYGI